jgi:hypothetical protein
MLKLLPILLFLASCSFCEEIYDPKPRYKFETFIKMKDTSQIIHKLEYEGSTLKLYPQSFLVKMPLSYLKPCKIKVYTSLDTGLIFVQPISNTEVVLKNRCEDGVEKTLFKEFEYSYNGKFQLNLIRSSIIQNEWGSSYTQNIDTLILE